MESVRAGRVIPQLGIGARTWINHRVKAMGGQIDIKHARAGYG